MIANKDYVVKMIRSFGDKKTLQTLFFVLFGALASLAAIKIFTIVFLVVRFPLEIEIRESTVWVQVLAMKAGINIYDHSKVAFVNMNHGPLDPILKYLISETLPFLSSANVTRSFVALLPLCLCIFCIPFAVERWIAIGFSLIASSLIFVSISSFPFFFPLVGRSDPTALCFLSALMILATMKWRAHEKYKEFVLGLFSGLIYLINWRYLPYAILISAVSYLLYVERIKIRPFFLKVGLYSFGAAIPLTAVLTIFFHWDLRSYWAHFFGFFGLGRPSAPSQSPGVRGIIFDKQISVTGQMFLLTALAILSICFHAKGERLGSKWRILFVSIGVMSGVFFFSALSLSMNYGGGGSYYFAPAYFTAWMFIVRFPPRKLWERLCVLSIAALIVFGMGDFSIQRDRKRDLTSTYPSTVLFYKNLVELDQKFNVRTEELYLFKINTMER